MMAIFATMHQQDDEDRISKEFDEYIYGLLKTENAAEQEIIACIDKAIDRFNRIGGSPKAKYGTFIETIEKDEILAFLGQAAEMAGLKIEHSIDDFANVIRKW